MTTDNENPLHQDTTELGRLLLGMRAAYVRGENVMEYARKISNADGNSAIATLIAYDLQSGSYNQWWRANPDVHTRLFTQLAEILDPLLIGQNSLLEIGSGEATTLAGVLQNLSNKPSHILGLDISWSRCSEGIRWLAEKEAHAKLFVADLFNIPLEDNSIDVVYTSHSLEPNGGREVEAVRELMRIARSAVVLVEPVFELSSKSVQTRMLAHGYVRGLKKTAEDLGANVTDYRLLDYASNPLNQSGLIVIKKDIGRTVDEAPSWRCPLTHTPLKDLGDVYFAEQAGLAYPVIRGIPMLRSEHCIIASKIED